ncbi:hypothetical protein BOTBODRAFT_70565 [Botryobasidium botryosum FD-172 SS1]|uniref:Uncharacterized protein n=1 Tax=Botryobasidium botryosum (strain FD-172 SS1) TaxID=930990 RepID=A0A067LVE9_BOTB1|nr:hypothetical protein BOTBODRAFT_70565 [Botryobasidium botryosum FD-172 SS1]
MRQIGRMTDGRRLRLRLHPQSALKHWASSWDLVRSPDLSRAQDIDPILARSRPQETKRKERK